MKVTLLVILGGITQKPGVDYTTTGTTITFTTAPVSNLTIHIRKLYGVQRIIGVNDGVISPVKLSTGGPVWNSSGNVTISGDLNVTGAFNAAGNGLFWEDSERATLVMIMIATSITMVILTSIALVVIYTSNQRMILISM